MALIFKYKREQLSDGKVKRPYIPIRLSWKESQDVFMLVDSGADFTFVPKGLAEFLGLDLSGKREKNRGVGGTIETVHTTANLSITKGHERYTFRIPVVVPMVEDAQSFSLLGRQGFFDKFDITFKENEQKIILKKVSQREY